MEDIFEQYQGPIIYVTHDRYFAKKIANSILYFSENKVEYYKGTYEEYEENKNKII